MSFIIGAAAAGDGKIGYKNLFTDSGAAVTASTEDTANGFHKENALDGVMYDFWKPTASGSSYIAVSHSSAKVANYAAVWGHNISDGGFVALAQYSTDGGSSWTTAAETQPSSNNVIFLTWDDITAADWRIYLEGSGFEEGRTIAGVQIGEVLTLTKGMEVGFAPPSMAPIVTLKTQVSESGAFIGGRKLSEGIEGSFSLQNIDPAWVRNDWAPFITHANTPKIFVFSWDDNTHSSEVVLAWITDKIPPPTYQTPLYMSISLKFKGQL